jgi:hypothetical protein
MFHSESLFPDPMLFGSATSRFTIDITSLELLYPNQTLLVFPRRRSSTAGSATAGSTLPTAARTLAARSATFRGFCPSLIYDMLTLLFMTSRLLRRPTPARLRRGLLLSEVPNQVQL